MDPPVRMLRPDLLSTEDRAQAILGYPADQLVLPDASYPAFIASRLTPFPAFVPVSISILFFCFFSFFSELRPSFLSFYIYIFFSESS